MGLSRILANAGDMLGSLRQTPGSVNGWGDELAKTVANTYNKARNVYEIFKQEQLPILLGKERAAQLAQVSSNVDTRAKQMALKTINRNLVAGFSSLGLAVAGSMFYWPLQLLSAPGILYGSRYTFETTYQALKRGKASVNLLVVVTILGAIVNGYFVVAAIAVIFFQLSRKIIIEVTDDSKKKLVDVFRQQPKMVWMLVDGVEMEVPVERLLVGDRVVVHGGQPIPIDGTIVEGSASIDQHILTGESRPAEKSIGDEVFATTVVLSGRILISVEKTGDETTVAQIGQILNRTVEYKANIQLRAEALADQTVIPTLILGGIALPFLGPYGALAVVNAHFKNLMNFTAPIGVMNFLNIAAQRGILIKDGRTLDLLNQVDTIVFDKTGTLTEAHPSVGTIYASSTYSQHEILRYAAAAEHNQTHPVADAIRQAAEDLNLSLPESSMATYEMGYGLSAQIEGKVVRVGSARYMQASGINLPAGLLEAQESSHQRGHSLIVVSLEDEAIGGIEMVPTVRLETIHVLNELRKRRNIREIYIISGDHEAPTRALADKLGVDGYFAETLPQNKALLIEELKAQGKFVCFVGDGINDAIALKASHVSISLRGGSTVAKDTAQAVLMDQGLGHLPLLFELAENCQRNLNLTFAAILSCTGIGMFGAFLLQFGLAHTITLNLLGLTLGTANSLRPLLQYREPTTLLPAPVAGSERPVNTIDPIPFIPQEPTPADPTTERQI
jgi:heavy metal translocating P-type ATPase